MLRSGVLPLIKQKYHFVQLMGLSEWVCRKANYKYTFLKWGLAAIFYSPYMCLWKKSFLCPFPVPQPPVCSPQRLRLLVQISCV